MWNRFLIKNLSVKSAFNEKPLLFDVELAFFGRGCSSGQTEPTGLGRGCLEYKACWLTGQTGLTRLGLAGLDWAGLG